MKDNAKAELEAIVEMALEWCKENEKNFLSIGIVDNIGMANLRTTDSDNKKIDIFMEGDK